jgi:hypothetical protein
MTAPCPERIDAAAARVFSKCSSVMKLAAWHAAPIPLRSRLRSCFCFIVALVVLCPPLFGTRRCHRSCRSLFGTKGCRSFSAPLSGTELCRRSCQSLCGMKRGRCSCTSLPGMSRRRCHEGALRVQLSDEFGRLGRSPDPVEVPIAVRTCRAYCASGYYKIPNFYIVVNQAYDTGNIN